MKKRVFGCTPSICCEIRKIGQHQIGVKIISVKPQRININKNNFVLHKMSLKAMANIEIFLGIFLGISMEIGASYIA